MLQSEEGISSNILSNRLEMLLREGIVTRTDDTRYKQKIIYSLTEKGIVLLPVFVHIGAWGRKYLPMSEELGIQAELLEKGGERMWRAFMVELRSIHLGGPAPRRSVFDELQAAFESVGER